MFIRAEFLPERYVRKHMEVIDCVHLISLLDTRRIK